MKKTPTIIILIGWFIWSRGRLSVSRPEALDIMFTPGAMYVILTVLLLITAVVGVPDRLEPQLLLFE